MSIQKALELLQIPDECAKFEGQITTRTKRFLIVEETHDFTVSPRKISVKVYSDSSTELFGAYTLNMISNYMHAYGHGMPMFDGDSMVMQKPRSQGSTTWLPAQRVQVSPAQGGHSFDVISEIGLNVNPDGTPADPNNPFVMGGVFYRVQKSITRSSDGSIKTWTSKKQFVRWTVGKLCEVTGMTAEEIAYATRMSFNSVIVNPETHITSIAMEIADLQEEGASGMMIEGRFYINGQHAKGAPGKIASYGKQCPSFLFRWNLYNGPAAAGNVLGASLSVPFSASSNNAITLIPGTENRFSAENNFMTYDQDASERPTIVAYAEFLPAQGKNECAGRELDIMTGISDIW